MLRNTTQEKKEAFSIYTNATDILDVTSARSAVEAIMRFMAEEGIITHKVHAGYNTEIIYESGIEQIHSEAAGIFVSMTETDSFVEENDILGKIVNPLDGETESVIKADFAGIVYFEYNTPLINENTVCFKIIKD